MKPFGSIKGKQNLSTIISAPGMWNIEQHHSLRQANTWPLSYTEIRNSISNIVSYWPLTAASLSGGAYVDQVSGYNLTKYGSIATNVNDARFGSVIDFGTSDGNDYLRSANFKNLGAASGLTVSFWFKSPNTINQWIISEGTVNTRWSIFFEPALLKWRSVIAGNVIDDVNWLDNNWHHGLITYNISNNFVQIYIDNALVQTGTATTASFAGEYILVGQHSVLSGNSDTYRYRGRLCALRVYEKVLNETEITSLYMEF